MVSRANYCDLCKNQFKIFIQVHRELDFNYQEFNGVLLASSEILVKSWNLSPVPVSIGSADAIPSASQIQELAENEEIEAPDTTRNRKGVRQRQRRRRKRALKREEKLEGHGIFFKSELGRL